MAQTLEKRNGAKIDSFDKLYPNKNHLPKGGFDNLTALPLQSIHHVKVIIVFLLIEILMFIQINGFIYRKLKNE